MRYLTWKLNWSNPDYGTGPEEKAAKNGAKLEASMWVNPDVEHGTILGYLTGNLDLTLLSDWEVQELTQFEALEYSQLIDENAYIIDNGVIATTTIMD
jgi:hypothetical protein